MSLKSFHIFFIVSSISLMAFVATWSGKQTGHVALLTVSALGLAASLIYLTWFLRHHRTLR